MKRTIALAVAVMLVAASAFAAGPKPQTLKSPDGKITVTVSTDAGISYSVERDGVQLIAPSQISMNLADGTVYGAQGVKPSKVTKSSHSGVAQAVVYRKSQVKDNYNELILKYKAFRVEFRAYDEGVAYRFVSASKKPFNVKNEQATFALPEDWNCYIPYVLQNVQSLETQFHNSFENKYAYHKVSEFDKTRYAFLPLVVEAPQGIKLCITESDLRHYPGMYLYNADGSTTLTGVNAPYPKQRDPEPGNRVISMYVHGVEDFIAKCEPESDFPWRVIGISNEDKQLLDNDLVYLLAQPADEGADFSWVKPGKVAWDWWNAWNLYGVDFKSGVNTETYKYYIDFASKNGIEYVILDEGWSPSAAGDLLQVVEAVDLDELIRFGNEKGVGLILWAGFYPFQRDIEGICKHYAEKGIKGFKVDFMDSDDQQIPEFLETSAATAAKYHLMLDFHGIYKPTGLSRKYPNIVNYEGIHGLEQMKWGANPDQVDYDVTVSFIRFFAGAADYTQGAMRNASKENVRSVNSEAMSPGTRCHQLGEYVVFFSPLNMLCDSPSNYIQEPECTDFIAQTPTVWDETIALDGEIAKFAVVARRSGDTWYVGGIGDWSERDCQIDLSFLGEGQYTATLFRDGVNADKAARDYKKESFKVSADKKVTIHMAPGGGFAMKISK